MNKFKLIHQDNSIDYQKILFERPIRKINTRKIGLVLGRNASLSKVNELYDIVLDFKHDIVLVCEPELRVNQLPADVFLESNTKKDIVYTNTDTAIQAIDNCNFSIVGIGFDKNSKMQLFIEKLIKSSAENLIFYPNCIDLFKTNLNTIGNRKADIYICNQNSLKKLISYHDVDTTYNNQASILNIVDNLIDVARKLKINLIYFNKQQYIFVSYLGLDSIGVINFDDIYCEAHIHQYVAILISLLCDTQDYSKDIIQRSLTAGYLLKKYLSNKDEYKSKINN